MNRFTVAAIQLDSGADKKQNLDSIKNLICEAAEKGAKLVSLPELANHIGPETVIESIPGGETFRLLSGLAKEYGIWIHGGSIHEINEAEPGRPYNTTMVLNPQGELAAKYRKLHASDMKFAGAIKESDGMCPGDEIVMLPTEEVGNWGLSICYDIRFGELYRLLTLKGAQILFVPACFYMQTGQDHWETMLRTRAIENGCYVIAAAQTGQKTISTTFQAYGKSMIIDPWGDVIARASNRPGVIVAEVDMDYLEVVRNKTCTLDNRRTDIYDLNIR